MKKSIKIRFNQILNVVAILAMICVFCGFFGWMHKMTLEHDSEFEYKKGYREGLIDGLDSCQVKVDTFYCFPAPDTKFKKLEEWRH